MTAIACATEQTLLGEGARWDARRDELLRVDILAGRVFRDRVAADGDLDPVTAYDVPGTVGAIAPIEGDEGWLLAANRGFARLAIDGSVRVLADVVPDGARMNDAACDPHGRFWAGTKADRAGDAMLYRLDATGNVEVMLDGLTISNGLGWSPDGHTMYLADSGPRTIHAFDYDGDRGAISNARVIVGLDAGTGAPDGLTVDADGDLWVAIWGAGQVRRYSPTGELRQSLDVPAAQSTCCAFGGSRLAPPVRHHGHRGLDRRTASGGPKGGARVPVRDRCQRKTGRAVQAGSRLVVERPCRQSGRVGEDPRQGVCDAGWIVLGHRTADPRREHGSERIEDRVEADQAHGVRAAADACTTRTGRDGMQRTTSNAPIRGWRAGIEAAAVCEQLLRIPADRSHAR